MIFIACLLFLVPAVVVGFTYWRRWHIVVRRRRLHYLDANKRSFDSVALYVRRGHRTWHVHPELNESLGLDPAREDFTEAMDAYMKKAKTVMASLRTSERIGARAKNGVWIEIPDAPDKVQS